MNHYWQEISIPNKSSSHSSDRLQVFRKLLQSYITRPLVAFLAKTKITPNMVTFGGFLVVIGAAVLAAYGHLFAAGWVLLASGVFDFIDGALARYTDRVTRFGGVLDSTLDRISEGAVLLGIMAYYISNPAVYREWIVIAAGIALIASFTVSYIRSRAEAAGLDCEVGIFTRTERVIILALGLLINQLPVILAVIAFLSAVTVIQRLWHVYRQAKGK